MDIKSFFAQDTTGAILPGATCYLYREDGVTLVEGLQGAGGTPQGNPFHATDYGLIQFSAPDGSYILRVTAGPRDYRIPVQCLDVTALLATLASLREQIDNHIGAGGEAHAVATESAAGFLAAEDKARLDALLAGGSILPSLSIGDATLTGDSLPALSVGDASLEGDAEPEDPETPTDPVPLGALMTAGAQILDVATGTPVQLSSVNWFGAEGTNHTPHGTWLRSYTAIVDQIAELGFNCIRLPFSGDIVGATPPPSAIDFALNPAFTGKTALEILDLIIDYAADKGLYVVLDHHRRAAGAGADGAPTDAGYSETDWHNSWIAMAQRYGSKPNVVGADLHNEPHDLTWNDWATLAEACGNALHAVAPHWLVMVEGVGQYNDDSYWWGGQLMGVATRPVVLTQADRVVYSPHEYGQSVGTQSWLAYDGQTPPANWPMNLYAVWRSHWGFIAEQGIAPIWIGEFGGKYGVDGTGTVGAAPHGAYEIQWTQELVKYLNGDFDGDGQRDLPSSQTGLSFAYWSLNPNSGDTGGLLQDDWSTPQPSKLDLLAPLFTAPAPTPAETLVDDDDIPLVDDDDTLLEDD
ncbi:endoglucanase [Azotobacter beijerinckii]|uniref:cellulase n=1 Tax=Azotobacter beijerinckii TaxID=170623 RepID=A0A1H9MPV5_9GAMM|nr:glycoside hydrolase family 5 protein [Azotobacter beijerinckii]SER25455.1 endoglucanase [Azotobacter beijerinckii]